MATRQANKGACDCCGEDCLCTCCSVANSGSPGQGVFTQWNLVLGGGSPILLTKVPGECKWASADNLYRVKRNIHSGGTPNYYGLGIYSSAGDSDFSPSESSILEQVGLFNTPEFYSWCRAESETAAIVPNGFDDPYLPTYGNDWSITPVAESWISCDDSPADVGQPNGTEPPNANWTECD